MLPMKDSLITVRVTHQEKARLEKVAAESGHTVAGLVRWLIARWIRKDK
jgi:hypothetical protein